MDGLRADDRVGGAVEVRRVEDERPRLRAAQAVVIDNARSTEALRASWRLTNGFWLRTFGVILLANIAAFLPASLVVLPLQALAESADRQAISLAGMILTETLTAPFVALVSTLLFFDLKARRSERQ